MHKFTVDNHHSNFNLAPVDLMERRHRSRPMSTVTDTLVDTQFGCINNPRLALAQCVPSEVSVAYYDRCSQGEFVDNKYHNRIYRQIPNDSTITGAVPTYPGPFDFSSITSGPKFAGNDSMLSAGLPTSASASVPDCHSLWPENVGPGLLVPIKDIDSCNYLLQGSAMLDDSSCYTSDTHRLDHDLSHRTKQELLPISFNSVRDQGVGTETTAGNGSLRARPNLSDKPQMNGPQYSDHTCLWKVDHGPCGEKILDLNVSAHLYSYHIAKGPRNAQLTCGWVGCSIRLKKESLLRHVREKHLRKVFLCPKCPRQFTRDHTRRVHLQKNH